MTDTTGASAGLSEGSGADRGPAPPGSDAFSVADRFFAGKVDHTPDPLFAQARCKLAEIVPERVWFMMTFCNVIIVRVPPAAANFNAKSTLLLVDAGAASAAEHIVEVLQEKFFDQGEFVSHCVYTHGHVDHVGAIPFIEAAQQVAGNKTPIELWAHEKTAARFKRYVATSGYNARINARQFAIDHEMLLPLFEGNRMPDREYSRMKGFDPVTNEFALSLPGGLVVRLIHAKGETDDGTVVFIPKQPLCGRAVVCPGDLVINCVPNCGNPQKVQRFPFEWCESLQAIENLDADVMLPGHGPLAATRARVAEVVSESRQFLHDLCTQTLRLLNENVALNDIVHAVRPKKTSKPFLRPVYDDPSFIVRNIYRLYGGWYTGYTPDLHPAPHHQHGADLLRLANGIAPFLSNMERIVRPTAAKADKVALRRALTLVEPVAIFVALDHSARVALCGSDAYFPVISKQEQQRLMELRSAILTSLSNAETSLMGRRIYAAAARDGPRAPPKL